MSEFLHMSGYGAYVWSAYAITLAGLVFNVFWARGSLRRARQEAQRRLAMQQEDEP
jgi:heme exporter protein CcmD